MNKQEYAVAYCDSHECDECYIYKNKLDKRTNTQLNSKYCFENIYDYLKKNKLDKLYNTTNARSPADTISITTT